MGKTAFCFPGQLQEKPILEVRHPLREDPHFQEWMERASFQTKFDLIRFSFKDETEAGLNLKLQISTYLLSMVYFHRLRTTGWVPDILAEHSMGIYAALAASEAITFEEGLFITESIGRLLEREGTLHRGAMASIVGLPQEEVQKICQDLNGHHIFIANYNGSMHYVLSGEEEGIEKAISLALSRKAISANRLAFNTALHSPSLFSLREEIANLLKDIEIHPPRFPILNHWTIRPLRKEEIKDFLSQEIGRPVYWVRCVEKLVQEGVSQFIEVGHEATLTKLIRWIDRDAEAFSAGDRLMGKVE
ncbi:MAG: ACP S-malonyltransferase [Thermodesulfobacteriota bacterium]